MASHVREPPLFNRVAIPLNALEPKPSLVPHDVWLSYQRELAEEGSELFAEAPAPAPTPDVRRATGPEGVESADFEVALLALSRVELFSKVDRGHLACLAHAARQGRYVAGTYLFHRGEHAPTFFVVLDGAVDVIRRDGEGELAVRRLGEGEPIGLFGLFSDQVRAASAAAIKDTVVLEIPWAALSELCTRDPAFAERLERVYELRLVESFIASSPLFGDLDGGIRSLLMSRFSVRRLAAKDVWLQVGEVPNRMGIVVVGSLLVEDKSRSGGLPTLYQVNPGQFLLVTSAFSGAPARMRVYAQAPTRVIELDHLSFAEVLREHPQLRAIQRRLPECARGLDRNLFCGAVRMIGA